VPGLRREEVAILAGMSPAYYLRLEQGRDTNPSPQIVDALARALRLDDKAIDYVHRLATATAKPRLQSTGSGVAGLSQLIHQIPLPAVVLNRYAEVLVSNGVARALSPGFNPGRNFLRWLFLDPAARESYVDWDTATAIAVSETREVAGRDLCDPELRALIDELTAASPRFCLLWARADVGYHTGAIAIRHPQLAELELYRSSLTVPHSDALHLLIYHAEPGSKSATALDELRARSVTHPPGRTPPEQRAHDWHEDKTGG
jgi:transcriptional regulator with XRE-family HTH domain